MRYCFLDEWAEGGKTGTDDTAIQFDHGPIGGGRIIPEGVGSVYTFVKSGKTDE